MNLKIRSIVVVMVLLLFTSGATYAASKVAISFDKYHGYTGTVDYLKAVNKAYPNITDLVEIGRSTQNRPIYVLAITNKKTGTTLDLEKTLVYERKLEVPNPPKQPAEQGKAGYLITGCTHGNEVTGNEVCLYFIDQMVSGYGTDPFITNFIDTKVAYVIPAINVDGLYNSVQLGAPQRVNSMNQVGTPFRQDVNKDGKYSQVRYKDPNGGYKIDPANPLRMVRIGRNETVPADQRYSVTIEALPDAGIDLNRNFPEAWWNTRTLMPAGSGDYATSAIETQVMCEFIVSHPNIFMVNEYHTQGGHVYRPLGSASDQSVKPRDLAVYDQILGKKYQELFGAEKLENVWKGSFADGPYYGLFLDWLYVQNGIYSMVTELWNPSQEIPSLKGLSGNDYQNALINYAKSKGMYLDWTKAKHPTYGDCEVGGWVALANNNAYPGENVLNICERQFAFDTYCMSLMPEMAIENVKVETISRVGNTRVLSVTADIVNKGFLPTSPQGTDGVALCRGDVAWLIGANNKITILSSNANEKLGNLYGTGTIPGFSGNNRSTVKWTVAVEGNEPLKIVASSLKGGTVVQNVKY
ncbi:MAG: hypothetical protein IJS02_00170 [Bacteroidales bacterium]|nr:hypothetical protein [Bacteroidales bacterium]